jgi:DNA-binding transcriptional LysR family regulator
MLAQLEALIALEELGTMTRAATRLRVTQSAVSKRIAGLEHEVGGRIIERTGRAVRVTPLGRRLAAHARPLLAALRGELSGEAAEHSGRIPIALAESILASWGALLLADVRAQLPRVALEIHAHRSPVAVDALRAGRVLVAIVAGRPSAPAREVVFERLGDEPMVIVPSTLAPLALRRGTVLDVLSIESASATARALAPGLAALSRTRGLRLRAQPSAGSYACLVQMARAGLGHSLVPVGIARAMGVPEAALLQVPAPGLSRPVWLAARKTSLARPLVHAFITAWRDAATRLRPLRAAD